MPRSVRLALLSALLSVAAVAAFLALRGSADTDAGDPASPAVAAASATTTTTATTATPATSPPVAAAATITTVTVRAGAPVGGVRELRVARGDLVDLRITADVADEVHVHGYDVREALMPGAPARLRFAAGLEGVFDVELHGNGALLVKLVVEPA